MKSKLVETYFSRNFYVDELRDQLSGDVEWETKYFIRRTLYKRILGIYIPILSQTILRDTNQAISGAIFGSSYDYSQFFSLSLRRTPDKIKYK